MFNVLLTYRVQPFLAALVLILGLAVVARAQDEAENNEEPQPDFAQNPLIEQPQPEIPNGGAGIRMNFKDASVDEVLEYLSERAGLVVVKTVDVEGRVTVFSRQEMSLEEAVGVLNSLLKEKGYAAVLLEHTLKIVDFDKAKEESIRVQHGADPAMIAKTDEMITQVIPLRFTDAEQLSRNLEPLLPNYAVIEANVRSNALIITDTSANVHRIARIVQSLDTSIANAIDVKVFPLEYADAQDAARLVNSVFGQSASGGGNNRGRGGFDPRAFFRGGRGGVEAGVEDRGGSAQQVQIKAEADERTNTVVVSGPPDTLKVVEQVIKDLDSNRDAEEEVFIYKVKNGDAERLADTLTTLFEGSSGGGRGNSRDNDDRRRFGGGNNTSTSNASTTNLVGQVDVVAEPDTNSLIIMTPTKNIERVRAIVEELDTHVPQVLIKVLIAEVTHDRSQDLGVEWSIINPGSTDSTVLETDFGLANLSGGLIFRLLETDIQATLRALETVGKLDVLSRPYILAHENQEASINVGQRVPFITNSRILDDGDVLNTIEYEEIGISLTVQPHINPAGLVVMDVNPVISSISDSTIQLSEAVDATIFNNRSATSRVAIKDGQTIVIGGLMQDQLEDTVNQVPFLGDIPLLGALFRSTSQKKTKTELLIFLTPHVARDPEELRRISDDERAGTKIVPKSVEPGMFDEHMRGMDRGGRYLDLYEQMRSDLPGIRKAKTEEGTEVESEE